MELFGLNQDLTRKVLLYIAETSPYGVVQEDCEMYLMGMSDKLSDTTMMILSKERDQILKLASTIENVFDEEK